MWRPWWIYAVGGATLVFLTLPTLVVVPMSFSDSAFLEFPPRSLSLRWYREFFGAVEWREAAWVSIRVAALTMVAATVLGTAAAYALRETVPSVAALLRLAYLAPLLVPVILIAIGVFFLFARLGLNNTLAGLVLAHTALALPFLVVTVLAGLARFDMNLERASRSLGATRLRAFLTVTVPQIRFSVLSAALFAFLTSFDEVVVALFIAGGDNATLTRRMFNSLRDEIDPTIAAISTCLVVVTGCALVASQQLSRGGADGRE